MIAVIFELEPKAGEENTYFSIAAELKPLVEKTEGLISLERFQSISNPEKFLSLSFWRDEDAVKAWRNNFEHRSAQKRGRAEIFQNYRLRVASVIRDYGLLERDQAPEDK
ncbi:MAG: antibiotic biosynthesis monooxygenase [Proteobacteria bacterium]|nr:antibiotic biosynthesis monooxygenase [Pseudomonadota bacterium]